MKITLIEQEGIDIDVASCCDPTAWLHPSRGGFPDIFHLGGVTEMRSNESSGSRRILIWNKTHVRHELC